MARTKINYDKVHFDGGLESTEHANVFNRASAAIRKLISDKFASATVNRVVINVGEGETAQQYGAAILKIKNLTKDGIAVLLNEIAEAGADAVQTAYNNFLRDKTSTDLETRFGDVTKQINDTVKGMLQYGGKAMTEEKALRFVLENRLASKLPCPAALLLQVGLEAPEESEESETEEKATA